MPAQEQLGCERHRGWVLSKPCCRRCWFPPFCAPCEELGVQNMSLEEVSCFHEQNFGYGPEEGVGACSSQQEHPWGQTSALGQMGGWGSLSQQAVSNC